MCLLSSLFLGLLYVQPVSGAWQQISDFQDCGSTNFTTELILVDFNSDTYWLNISIMGNFTREVVDASNITNKASIYPPKCKCEG